MLNIGLVGNTEVLEPFVKRIRKNKGINIIGKASVGTSTSHAGFHFSIPEFNRVELIERADVLLIDNSSVLPFHLLCDIVKKSKHIFTVEYLDLTIDECSQLVKLVNESRSVFQVSNPYFYTNAIQWMNKNIATPVFLDVLDFVSENKERETLYPLVLMLLGITGISPKKIGAVTFNSAKNGPGFTNVRLEFGDASVVSLSYGSLASLTEFKIRAYSNNHFATFNFTKNTFVCNNSPIDFLGLTVVNEFDSFINSIHGKTKRNSSIEDYLIAMHLVLKINKKLTQFFTE